MSKYLLKFSKKGYMRFISHLDLGRLLRRAIKRSEIDVQFSNGFNPHEKINIVMPLSLGYESDCEYFEISTFSDRDCPEIMNLLNSTMPLGIKFYECKKADPSLKSLTNLCSYAEYSVCVNGSKEDYEKLDTENFVDRNEVYVYKRDKKTKSYVQKDVKAYIRSIEKLDCESDSYNLRLVVKCATNESLNPVNLLNALYEFSGIPFDSSDAIINRVDLYGEREGSLVSLYEL